MITFHFILSLLFLWLMILKSGYDKQYRLVAIAATAAAAATVLKVYCHRISKVISQWWWCKLFTGTVFMFFFFFFKATGKRNLRRWKWKHLWYKFLNANRSFSTINKLFLVFVILTMNEIFLKYFYKTVTVVLQVHYVYIAAHLSVTLQ